MNHTKAINNGGVIILGNAEISADADRKQIEGIPASDNIGLYGGSDNNDNSELLDICKFIFFIDIYSETIMKLMVLDS